MTQGSMPWDDPIGDAAPTALLPSPYHANEWHAFWNALMGSSQATVWVIPGIGGNLAITQNSGGASMHVEVAAGEALVNGARYKNTAAELLVIDTADATNPRLDRIVLRWRYTASTGPQDIRLAVVKGTAAATPTLPALTQSASVYEIEIGYVWVGAGVTSIVNAEIHDQRTFAPNLFGAPFLSQENLIQNSEFLMPITVARTYPPAFWNLVGTPSAIQTATKPSQMARGNAIQLTADAANEGIDQSYAAIPSAPYAIRLLYNITAGDVGQIVVTTDSASPGTITRNLRRTGTWLEEWIYYMTESDAAKITVRLEALNSTDVVKFGQVLAQQGYHTGPFRAIDPNATEILLDEISLTADQSTIDFQLIPGDFRSLRLVCSLRTNYTAIVDDCSVRFNNDSAANYDSVQTLESAPAVFSCGESVGATSIRAGRPTGANAPANNFNRHVMEIPYYAVAGQTKQLLSYGMDRPQTSDPRNVMETGWWNNTGSAINRITLLPGVGTAFVSGSRVALYGVR